MWNDKVNLTSIKNEDTALVLHVEDSLIGLPFIKMAPEGKMVDIGTGGGFPGIPLAVVGNRKCTLVDAREKKIRVLDEFIKAQRLEELLSTQSARAEELALLENGTHAAVTARALSSLPVIMELASPLLTLEGLLIAYKGNLTEEETQNAQRLQEKLGLTIVATETFTLSDKESQRTLVVFEKNKEAEIKLPRRPGMAQKKPLG
jgi:16S rRNA (guanine527-N7)-methyltransferase